MFDLPPEQPWERNAACRDHDPALWDGDNDTLTGQAVAICRGCPSRTPCLTFALDHEVNERDERKPLAATARYGIYGGLTPEQRAKLARGAA